MNTRLYKPNVKVANDCLGYSSTSQAAPLGDMKIAPYQVAEHASASEIKLLRAMLGLESIERLDGEFVTCRIDNIFDSITATSSIRSMSCPGTSTISTPSSTASRTSTILHYNTHLSMLLKRTGFADRDAIPRGISGSVVRVR
jgi:hypothetical protein